MAVNEPVNCPNCGTEHDAMPDDMRARYENVPGAPSPAEANVLNKIKKVGFVCTNCGQKFSHTRIVDPPGPDPDTAPRG